MSVIDFAAKKAERQPHTEGMRICLGCRSEWHGIAPVGVNVGLECPVCLLPKGVTKNLYGFDDGDTLFHCGCGCDALFSVRAKCGHVQIRCLACGENHTENVFEC